MTDNRICPWWLAYTFDNPLRRYFQDPQVILAPYLRKGMTALDLGCGMGFFSRAMAKIVGDGGKVISVDLQAKMLAITRKRAEKDGVARRIQFLLVKDDELGVTEQVDFALAFWMVHEVTDARKFFRQIFSILKPAGTFLIAEPKMHVTQAQFDTTLLLAAETGFHVSAAPVIRLSRAVVCKK